MRRSVKMAMLVLALSLVLSAQLSAAGALPKDPEQPIDVDPSAPNATPSDLATGVSRSRPRFELSRISNKNIKDFGTAWNISNNGTSGKEGLILLFRTFEGGYMARIQHKTNEMRQVTFTWVPNAVAVVHTHPNRNDPRPSNLDIELADRFNVPMITITIHGMYVYEPATKKTTRVFDGLDWLESAKWAKLAESTKAVDLAQQ